MSRRSTRALALTALVMGGTACQDLAVDNTNQPDRIRALSNADAVEVLVSSAYATFWQRMQRGTAGYLPLPHAGEEVTSSLATSGSRNVSQLPRIPFNNNPVVDDHAVPNLYWNDMYAVFSNATDAIRRINEGMKITTGNPVQDNTHRALVYGRLAQGMSMGYLGLLFDRAFIVDETTPQDILESPVGKLQLSTHQQVVSRAIEFLMQSAQLATQGNFTIPRDWLYAPTDATRDDVIQMAHAYAARFRVLQARTPQERQAVDWQAVLDHTSKVTRNIVVELTNATGRPSIYLQNSQHLTSASRLYAHPNLYGPADISGKWQAWLNTPPEERQRFVITTPDRRITGATPTSNGSYFVYATSNNVDPNYGSYRESHYQWRRLGGAFQTGTHNVLTVDEMRLYRAEAMLRLNRLQEAADLINVTRVANGKLPPVTAQGVPEAADCVPRTRTGACGSLLDALIHERMIELSFMDPTRTYLDRRGFGTLTPGTFIHLPIPGAQQEILGLTHYTFGGGGPGSAQ